MCLFANQGPSERGGGSIHFRSSQWIYMYMVCISLYARFCKYTTNMLIIYILHFHANVHTLLIFNRLYLDVCSTHVRAQLLYNVCPCVILCISWTGSKDIWKLEFNIVEIYISYSFLIVKSFVTFCTNCIFC